MPKKDRHESFGRRLIYAMQRRDFTATALAKLSGMGETEISHYTCDRRTPGADNVRRLAKALDISADFLLDLSNDTRRINEIAESPRS